MEHGAPFPFITWEDVQRPIDGRPLHEWMLEAIEEEKMPLPPVTLTAEERETLVSWLREGAPVRNPSEVCSR